MKHIPVLKSEVLDYLCTHVTVPGSRITKDTQSFAKSSTKDFEPNTLKQKPSEQKKFFLDCTLGAGGHTKAILDSNPKNFVLAIDRDPSAISYNEAALKEYGERLKIVKGNFSDLEIVVSNHRDEICDKFQIDKNALNKNEILSIFSGILADLGFSSDQLEDLDRGLSFNSASPLDMRLDRTQTLTADTLLNQSSFLELKKIFLIGGVGPISSALARTLIEKRPILNTQQFADICVSVCEPYQKIKAKKFKTSKSKHHAATVPFQALRIAVNDEFSNLEQLLESAVKLLTTSGRLAIISFHSLEDKIVTKKMRQWSVDKIFRKGLPITGEHQAIGSLLTKDAILPSTSEIESNPRSRSARMRVFEKRQQIN